MKRNKFFVLALPRSRTYWLSKFLSTDTCVVEHDGCCNYPDVKTMLRDMPDGNCDTGLALLWEKLEGRIVVVLRSYADCVESLKRIGFSDSVWLETIYKSLLDAANIHPSVRYKDLDNEATCKWLFEYLTQETFDRDRWVEMKSKILEVSIEDELERFAKNNENIRSMFGEFL